MRDARENAPRTVRTFGRASRLRDFEDQVRATGEVAKAKAPWIWDGLDQAIHLTIAAPGGARRRERTCAASRRALGAVPRHQRRMRDRRRRAGACPVRRRHRADRPRPRCRGRRSRPPRPPSWTPSRSTPRALASRSPERPVRASPGRRRRPVARHRPFSFQASRPVSTAASSMPSSPNAPSPPADGSPQPVQGHLRIFGARPRPATRHLVRPAELAVVVSPGQDVTITAAAGGSA